MELGPCRVLDADEPKYRPESWNANATIFFLITLWALGSRMETWLEPQKMWVVILLLLLPFYFESFTQFKGRTLYMAGKSYGGPFFPLFASVVYDNNDLLRGSARPPINLKSIMIDSIAMVVSNFVMECTPASVPPILDISTCVAIKSMLSRSVNAMGITLKRVLIPCKSTSQSTSPFLTCARYIPPSRKTTSLLFLNTASKF
ncbi:uncharacterized protein ARMOST_02483 [Armillaria ostoyae]|uniref:Uncharacterized protein n=1 Tax=Armillaria ostoyae TaxID=47428 RepID=A0A284QS06_ARMOS|nr:uncharacterized protein ARMOST_02483 [Armillaria ostoyae]